MIETTIDIHAGVHHGFAFSDRWCHDETAAERQRERLMALDHHRPG